MGVVFCHRNLKVYKMPPILTEEPPNPNGGEEEEEETEEIENNATEDMDDDGIGSDFDESHEFSALDKQLDELNSVLDKIEAKNDDIHGKLKEFLQASRQERLELTSTNDSANGSNSENNDNKK